MDNDVIFGPSGRGENFSDLNMENFVSLLSSNGLFAFEYSFGRGVRLSDSVALELAQINPESVPVNILTPIEGTPFEGYKNKIDEDEVVRTMCIFRIAMPKAQIRFAGGRSTRLSQQNQELCLKAGVNGVIVGNYLTTAGVDVSEDRKTFEKLGKVLV